ISESYILQIQGYMYLKGANTGIWAIFHPDPMDVLDPNGERDNKLIDKIIEGTENLWAKILKGEEPPQLELGDFRCKTCPWIDTCWKEQAMTIDGAGNGSDLEDMTANDTLSKAITEYKEAQENLKIYDEIKSGAEDRIKIILGNTEKARCGDSKIYFRAQSRSNWDLKKLEHDKPELKEAYKRESIFKTLKVY
ncbi:MAG TPA: hypothetical protein ACFYEK_11030, partial [Candidatus Wunengus sp. YC60]|uniref:hypothetical protein n=1 Tax=Candidatus Wunengus sp. YC60 TaxID=3367697 RepID=UPI004024F851